MMHKCIKAKIRGRKKRKLSKKREFHENRGIYKFWGIRGKCNIHHWLRGMDAPGHAFPVPPPPESTLSFNTGPPGTNGNSIKANLKK